MTIELDTSGPTLILGGRDDVLVLGSSFIVLTDGSHEQLVVGTPTTVGPRGPEGPEGPKGPPGDDGTDYDDLEDFTLIYENGLI